MVDFDVHAVWPDVPTNLPAAQSPHVADTALVWAAGPYFPATQTTPAQLVSSLLAVYMPDKQSLQMSSLYLPSTHTCEGEGEGGVEAS